MSGDLETGNIVRHLLVDVTQRGRYPYAPTDRKSEALRDQHCMSSLNPSHRGIAHVGLTVVLIRS
jgi:hypothetical protein